MPRAKKKKSKPTEEEDPPSPPVAAVVMAGAAATKVNDRTNDDNDDDDDEASLDIGACCLCHCSLDYSDKAAFDPKDRHEDYEANDDGDDGDDSSFYFRKNDPYLPESLQDAHNALLYCDSCPRLFHQQCHFVPVLNFAPSKPWNCLICQVEQQHKVHKKASKKHKQHHKQQQRSPKKKKNKQHNAKQKDAELATSINVNASSTCIDYPYDRMFQSPPIPEAAALEEQWEHDPRVVRAKAIHLQKELTALARSLQTPVTAHKRALAALETLTSSTRNREHFAENSQELKQCVYTVTAQRYRIQQLFHKLERVRRSTALQRRDWQILVQWVHDHAETHADFIQRTLFPFGTQHARRWIPVTPEYHHNHNQQQQQQQQLLLEQPSQQPQIPTEVIVHSKSKEPKAANSSAAADNETKHPAALSKAKSTKGAATAATKKKVDSAEDDDDDDGFSLDNLECCVCLKGDSTDDNDVILCDGQGCYRAYHAQCVHPHVKIDEDDLDHDWFCPLCQCMCDTLLHVQVQVSGGDEWEQRRMEAAALKKIAVNTNDVMDDDASSLKSWAVADDVFPNAAMELETAQQLKQGVSNAQTAALLAKVLGEDGHDDDDGAAENGLDEDEEDDNVDEDGHFDLNSYQEERRLQKEQMKNEASGDDSSSDGSESTHSSQATLVEMSSVELEIPKDELAALTDIDSDDDEIKGRVTRRQKTRRTSEHGSSSSDNNNNLDNGKLDTSNIVLGKRKRNPVNYIKLNDALFGEVSEKELAKIDDANDDFVAPSSKSRKSSSSSSNDDSADSSSDDDSSDSGSDNGDADESSGKKIKVSSKRTKKAAPPKRNGTNGLKGRGRGAQAKKTQSSETKRTPARGRGTSKKADAEKASTRSRRGASKEPRGALKATTATTRGSTKNGVSGTRGSTKNGVSGKKKKATATTARATKRTRSASPSKAATTQAKNGTKKQSKRATKSSTVKSPPSHVSRTVKTRASSSKKEKA